MSVKITRIHESAGKRRSGKRRKGNPHLQSIHAEPDVVGRRISRMQRSRPVILQGMEPGLADRGPGRISFLNRASSSAASTLATAMQQVPGEPFLHVSPDHLVASGMLPRPTRSGWAVRVVGPVGVRSAPSL